MDQKDETKKIVFWEPAVHKKGRYNFAGIAENTAFFASKIKMEKRIRDVYIYCHNICLASTSGYFMQALNIYETCKFTSKEGPEEKETLQLYIVKLALCRLSC